jgi:hypothetical protein
MIDGIQIQKAETIPCRVLFYMMPPPANGGRGIQEGKRKKENHQRQR